MTTSPEIFEIDEENEDAHEFISSLFGLEEKILLNSKLFPLVRLERLNDIREKVFKEIDKELKEDPKEKEIYNNAAKTLSHIYLIRIFQDLFDIDIYEFDHSKSLVNNILYIIQKNITYLDVLNKNLSFKQTSAELNKEILKELFKDEKEFNYVFLTSERDCNKKRELIMKEAFNENSKRYLNVFKEKLLFSSTIIYKQLLFLELQRLDYKEISEVLIYLMNFNDFTYINPNNNQSKNADLFFKNNYWGELLTKEQKTFYSSIQSVWNKLKKNDFSPELLTEHNKDIIQTILWLKSFPEEALKTLEILTDLYEKEHGFALDKPNNLILHLYRLKERISSLAGKVQPKLFNKKISDLSFASETFAKRFCDAMSEKSYTLCKIILNNETLAVKSIIKTKSNKKLKQITKKLPYIILAIIFVTVLKFGQYYFFDIQNIYSNNFIKNAKLTMESTPYFVELKDSLDPITNETNQKLRLDHINNLNSRYFKVLTIFLNPDISDEVIKNSLPSLAIPANIKKIDSIKAIRSSLDKVFTIGEWKKDIEPMFGPNILAELRAYGAICNFLIPSLGHYLIKDKSGEIKIYIPKNEKTLLGNEPKIYIDRYDTNYKTILRTTNTLLKEIKKKRLEVFTLYEKSLSKEERIRLKTILQGIAITEVKLKDLESKIQARHDFIVKHNTYRAPLE